MGGFEQGMLILAVIVLFNALLAAMFPLPVAPIAGDSNTAGTHAITRTVHKLHHPSGQVLGAVVRGQP